MKNRGEGASSLSFGMSHVLTRMQLRTLELLWNGWQNAVLSMLMPSLAWLSCTIGTTWPICSVPVTGSLNPKTPLSPEESPPVLAWQPIQLSLPKPELVSWLDVAKSLFSLSQKMEEAYARATVAITRARALCLIMGPLDMKGLLGAATVMGTLMYGAGHVWAGRAHFYLHDHELSRSPPDESFIDMLKQNCCLSGPHFPPPAIVEVLQDYVTNFHKVRRLHLIVVDLWRPWKYNTARAREITDQLWLIRDCDNTRRVSPFRPDGPEPPLRCRWFAYGYALDGSVFPCYLVWPQRDGRSYVLLDTATTDALVLDQSFFRPLGMQHFYDSFALVSQICVRRDALVLFGLNDDELLPDLHITRAGVLRAGIGAHLEHVVNQDAQAADRKKAPAEVIQVASHEVDTDSDKALKEAYCTSCNTRRMITELPTHLGWTRRWLRMT